MTEETVTQIPQFNTNPAMGPQGFHDDSPGCPPKTINTSEMTYMVNDMGIDQDHQASPYIDEQETEPEIRVR